MRSGQTAFQIDVRDTVATALAPLEPGAVRILGDAPDGEICALDAIPAGHKLAVRDMAEGEDVIKYGVSIGVTTRPVARGSWVHLHCLGSRFDEKSNAFDPETGASMDTRYE